MPTPTGQTLRVSQPPPGSDDPNLQDAGTTIRTRFTTTGLVGNFIVNRSLSSSPPPGNDDPNLLLAGVTARTQLGPSVWVLKPRVISQPPLDNPPQDGWTSRIPLQGTGQTPAAIVPRRVSWPPIDPPEPQESGFTRRIPLLGTGQSASPKIPPRQVYTDDSPPEAGFSHRTPLAPTGLAAGPAMRPRLSADPDGSPQPQSLPETRRTPLTGTGQVPLPVVPRVRVCGPVPGDDDPNLLAAGVTWRGGWVPLSNDGYVIAGPYTIEAMAIYQAGAVAGVVISGGNSGGPPAAPVLTAAAIPSGIQLTWPAVPGANSYSVYRSTTSGAEQLYATGVASGYVDTGAIANVTYYYEVVAINAIGNTPSNEVSAVIPVTLLTNLLAYWTLNQSSGNRADSSGNGKTMVQTGSVTGAAGFGNVGNVSVFGSGYLQTVQQVLVTAPWTIAGWFNIASAGNSTLCSFSTGSTNKIALGIGPKLTVFLGGSGIGGVTVLSASTWYFVTVTYDGVNVNLYLNGSSTPELSGGLTASYGSAFTLGDDTIGAPTFFNGSEVGWGVWGRVLSATGIANLFNSNNGQAYSSLGSLAG